MKLLTLIVITLTINFAVLMKSSFISTSLNKVTLIDIIDQQSQDLYIKGKFFVNDLKNTLMIKFNKYSQFVKVSILGKNLNKHNQPFLSEKNIRHSSGESNNDISKKGYPCFL